jgi:hypothetical protein
MIVLHFQSHVCKYLQTFADGELLLVAYLVMGVPLTSSMTKKGRPGSGVRRQESDRQPTPDS